MISRRRRTPATREADEQVSIITACRLIGVDLPEGIGHGRNMKLFCPFGDLYHSDGGVEAALRVYTESNSIYCFAGCGAFGPVSLLCHAWGISRRAAARELLERAGLRRPTTAEIWAAVVEHYEPPNTAMLAEALTTFCRRTIPDWDDRQFEPPTAATLTRCLALLDHVHTDSEAAVWLSTCKAVMAQAPERSGNVPSPSAG